MYCCQNLPDVTFEDDVSLLLYFGFDKFTTAIFNNFDHVNRSSVSGANSNQVAAMTLFNPQISPSKRNKSTVTLEQQERKILLCREIYIRYRRKKEKIIPDNSLFKKMHKNILKLENPINVWILS